MLLPTRTIKKRTLKKTNMKNSMSLILLVFSCLTLHHVDTHAQDRMAKERLDSISLSLVNFFKERGYFEKDKSVEKCLKTIYGNDMLSTKLLGDDPIGIYTVGVLIGRARRFVLIVDSNGWKIENNGALSELEDMTAFFKRHHVKNSDIDKYLRAVLLIHEYNEQ